MIIIDSTQTLTRVQQMKIRTKILRTPPVKVETPDYIVGLTVIATSGFMIAACLSPLFLNFPAPY